MANYDSETQKFIEDVAGTIPRKEPDLGKEIRTGMGLASSVLNKRPQKLVKNIGQALHYYVKEDLEKTGGVQYSKVVHIFGLLNQRFEKDWHDWEPETLWHEFGEEEIEVDSIVKNIVMALQLVTQSNAPFEYWYIFENVGHAFAGNDVNFGIVQPLELTEIAAAIKILRMLRPKAEFENEVCGYIAACAKNSGVVFLPSEFFPDCAQQKLDEMGNDLELLNEVKRTWPKVVSEETPVGIQTQRLDEIREYASEQ